MGKSRKRTRKGGALFDWLWGKKPDGTQQVSSNQGTGSTLGSFSDPTNPASKPPLTNSQKRFQGQPMTSNNMRNPGNHPVNPERSFSNGGSRRRKRKSIRRKKRFV